MNDRARSSEQLDRRWRLWMIAAQAGDAEAYESLLRDLLPFLSHLVGRFVHAPDEREDIVQNVLISLHRARHTYRPDQPILPWLRAIARNGSIDFLRRRGRRARFESSGDVESASEPWVEAESPEARSLSPRLAGALAALPIQQRQAVELIHVEGLSVAEAAHRAGVTPGALKVRAHRGYRALRSLLERSAP
jgi:RNA polymerase sigma-70 factor (ECF subfamily)